MGGKDGRMAPMRVSPRSAETTFLATSVATRAWASLVKAPRCGVAITHSWARSRCETGSSLPSTPGRAPRVELPRR